MSEREGGGREEEEAVADHVSQKEIEGEGGEGERER
jgi:hypothetical protein